MVVDSLNSEVGAVENLYDGLVSRLVAGDQILLYANVNGFVSGSVVFYHLTPDCSAERYLPNVNRGGFAFVGQAFGSSVVYTRAVDPSGSGGTVQPLAMETVLPGEDINAPGPCVELGDTWPQSMGRAVVANDPALGALRPPFRLR